MRWTKTMQMIEAHAEGEIGRIRTIDTWIILPLYANKITLNLSSPSIKPPRSEAQRSTQSRPCPPRNINPYQQTHPVTPEDRGSSCSILRPMLY
jgi:hypothetical protein